jgi:hypothetical protein
MCHHYRFRNGSGGKKGVPFPPLPSFIYYGVLKNFVVCEVKR